MNEDTATRSQCNEQGRRKRPKQQPALSPLTLRVFPSGSKQLPHAPQLHIQAYLISFAFLALLLHVRPLHLGTSCRSVGLSWRISLGRGASLVSSALLLLCTRLAASGSSCTITSFSNSCLGRCFWCFSICLVSSSSSSSSSSSGSSWLLRRIGRILLDSRFAFGARQCLLGCLPI